MRTLLVVALLGTSGCLPAEAWVAGAQAFSQGMQQPVHHYGSTDETSSPQSSRLARSVNSCSSDYTCRYGWHCVKPNYSTEGTCMQEVSGAGVPTNRGPSASSSGAGMPKPNDCNHGGVCPGGFHCDSQSGACIQ